MPDEPLNELVDHLLKRPERRWIEHKENNSDPERIGKYISALSNCAALDEKPFGYLIWGVKDGSREPIGTEFDPFTERRGNQSLEFWLAQQTEPTPQFDFHEVDFDGNRLVLLKISAASTTPVRFQGRAYVRIGDATPELSRHADLEQKLWEILQSYRWENGIARQFVTSQEVTELLDYGAYFRLLGQPIPEHRDQILGTLAADRIIEAEDGGRWSILNLGAILFAEQLQDFDRIARKAVRVIRYVGDTRVETVQERSGKFGYAKSFEALILVIDSQLPKRERIGRALRQVTSSFPELSIRELVANALIHQDMTIAGAGPMIEIFDNRLEVTNPGRPLVEPSRFIDHPPRSRNEAMAALMRRMNICEERGSGIDKVVFDAERNQLPPPDFAQLEGAMRVTLYGPRPFADMTPSERMRACYQHATLKFLQGDRATNASLRGRFGIEAGNAAQVSRVFRQTSDSGLIKLADPSSPRSGYIPWWA